MEKFEVDGIVCGPMASCHRAPMVSVKEDEEDSGHDAWRYYPNPIDEYLWVEYGYIQPSKKTMQGLRKHYPTDALSRTSVFYVPQSGPQGAQDIGPWCIPT